jgi:ABC-type dipeptide/oligopeptide/nickel transport system permease component
MLIIVLCGATLLAFVFSNLSPTDPAEAFVRRTTSNPSQEQIAIVREEMGLNKPLAEQYFSWIGKTLQGDLGISLRTRVPVAKELPNTLFATLGLAGMAMIFVALFTVPISIYAAARKGGPFDQAARIITILGMSLPNFWIGCMLLVFFAIIIPIFKVVDFGSVKSTVLPALALAVPITATSIRVLRSSLISGYQSDFVTYARALGLPESKINRMVLKDSIPPMITLFFQQFGFALAGSAAVEGVFSWPGIGSYMVSGILARDLPVINASVLVIAVLFVLINFAADMINLVVCRDMERGKEGYRA